MEYENNAMIVKVDTDDEYDFARDMQVIVAHDTSLIPFLMIVAFKLLAWDLHNPVIS